MSARPSRIAVLVALAIVVCGCGEAPPSVTPVPPVEFEASLPPVALETPHYTVHSSATKAQVEALAAAIESLHAAYADRFPVPARHTRFHVVLHADRATFKQHNRCPAWAEACYSRAHAFAYPADGGNPHHWMLHEATHQLIAEGSGYKPRRWLGEGLASCYGASAVVDGGVVPGRQDAGAYPVRWLRQVSFDREQPSFEGRKFMTLPDVVEESGPPIAGEVNHYYVAWWSLAHYLLHGDDAAHRDAVRALLEEGGSPAAFQALVGRYDEIEPRWHRHLAGLAKDMEASLDEPVEGRRAR